MYKKTDNIKSKNGYLPKSRVRKNEISVNKRI